jgi:hypothetical protein
MAKLPELLSYIQEKKKLHATSDYYGNTYSIPAKTFTFSVDTASLRKQGVVALLGKAINFILNNDGYLISNEFIMLDIINSNYKTRPVYFTATERMFEDYLFNEGFVYRLLPLDQSKKALNEKLSIKKKLNFVKEKLALIPSNDFSRGITFSGFENQAYPLYASIASWYIKNKKPNEAKMLINELLTAYKNNPVFSYTLSDIWFALLEAGDLSAISHLEAYAKKIESLYLNTNPANGYLSKAYAAYYLDNMIEKLEKLKITNEKIKAIRERL